jgi:1-acyl-sn-glycerol-3-phosphate acyltransferase
MSRTGRGKVVPIRPVGARRLRAAPPKAQDDEAEALRSRLRGLEREFAREGLFVRLARLIEKGSAASSWEKVARGLSAAYFTWHSESVDDFGYDEKFAASVRPALEFLYNVWWRVEATGVANVPGTGPALVVANHSGVLPYDGLMMHLAIRQQHPARRECRLLALDMFALLPFLAPLLQQLGAVRASQENGERLLRGGELVGVFPEGVKGVGKPFRRRYQLARFGRGGFVRLALRTGAPLVPCAIVGAEEIHPMIGDISILGRPLGLPFVPVTPTFPLLGPLGLVPLPSKWSIDFADPIATDGYGAEAADDPILVNRLAETVRTTIQGMIDGRLARRRSVWFG